MESGWRFSASLRLFPGKHLRKTDARAAVDDGAVQPTLFEHAGDGVVVHAQEPGRLGAGDEHLWSWLQESDEGVNAVAVRRGEFNRLHF